MQIKNSTKGKILLCLGNNNNPEPDEAIELAVGETKMIKKKPYIVINGID